MACTLSNTLRLGFVAIMKTGNTVILKFFTNPKSFTIFPNCLCIFSSNLFRQKKKKEICSGLNKIQSNHKELKDESNYQIPMEFPQKF